MSNSMSSFKDWLSDHILDILLCILALNGFIVASPLVVKQFRPLKNALDIIWNIGFDLFCLTLFLILFYILSKLLKRLNNWLNE